MNTKDREIEVLRTSLQNIIDIGYDYDGYENSLTGCKGLIDEFVNIAYNALYKHQSITFLDSKGNIVNVFNEVIGDYDPNDLSKPNNYYDKNRKDY